MRAVAALGLCLAFAPPLWPASFAQDFANLQDRIPPDSQMLLEADSLVYDRDQDTISAVGGVRIEYAGNRLVANRVTYNRRTGRLLALGKVEILDPAGVVIRAEEIDITDDFRDGFVNSLEVETTDETFFGAESAERRDGNVTTFTNGAYTACRPCEDNPDKPRIWRIKAQKIIWNGEARTIRFEHAAFELFGMPIARLPAFQIADHTVRRKTGFLIPEFSHSTGLGYGITVPFYIALSPSYDLTLRGSGFTQQGFLGKAEWRQRLDTGSYSLKIAGIHQANPSAFAAGTVDALETNRGMVGSAGDFRINPRWTFGWNILAQTDKNFSRTYRIEGFDSYIQRSEIFLTGLHDRNFLDLRFMHFDVQEKAPDWVPGTIDGKQPWVLPSFDYSRVLDAPVAGGELSFDINAQALYREREDFVAGVPAIPGLGGKSGRLTAEAEWRRTFVTGFGLVVMPSLHARGDAIHSDPTLASLGHIATVAAAVGAPADIRSGYYRGMATAGLEVRYPILLASAGASHIVEPIGQIFVRPDEPFAESLGIPNEDAQSFVFDASTLFERDKFSGYDRIEGGTRANLGLRYSAAFGEGWTGNALLGQSYHLAGTNSFASPDLMHAGTASGLETARSDYVAMAGLAAPTGISASVSGRFDEETLEVRRAEIKTGYSSDPVEAALRYTYIEAQPLYGMPVDRRELELAGTVRFDENWRAFGAGTYDFVSGKLVGGALGFGYEDECISYVLAYKETRSILGTLPTERSIGFRLSLRTLGDFGSDTGEPRF